MKHFYLFCLLLFCSNPILAQVNQHINYAHESDQILDPLAITNNQGTGASVEVVGNRMFVSQLATDQVLVYERANASAPWAVVKRISRPDALSISDFGNKIAAWGDYLIVGDETNGAYSFSSFGKVFIFHKNAGGINNWGLVKFLLSPTPTNNGSFGYSVDIEDNKIIVGAVNEKKAYLFEKDNGGADNWGLSKTFTTPTSTSLSFGQSVVLANNLLFIGGGWNTSGYSSNKGEVRIYGKDNGGTDNWGLIKSIREGRNTFGSYLAVSGNTLVVGSPQYASDVNFIHAGHIFIFDKDLGGTNNWGLQQTRVPTNLSQLSYFGIGVAIDGDKIIVGARRASSGQQVYYFNRTTGGTNNWGQFGLLLASDNQQTEVDRGAFKFSGNDVYIGSAYGNAGSVSAGKVYKYSFDECFHVFTQLYDTIYYDEALAFGNNVLQYEGMYEHVIPKADGCDSTLVMNLEVASRLNFADPFGFAGGDGVYDVTLGDINGDGKLDMVTANYLAGNISVFQNQTATGVINPASFKSSFTLPAGPKATKVKIFDVDGDGKNDIVSLFYGTTASINDSIFVYRNIGAVGGTMNAAYFAPKVAFEVGNRPIDMSIADLDGDGLKDIAVVNFATKTVSMLRNESTPGTIAYATKLDVTMGPTGTVCETIRTEDINGDGKPDIICTTTPSGRIYVAENASVPGGLYFLSSFQMFFSGGNPGSTSIADFDHDGCKDIAQVRYKSGYQVAMFKSNCGSNLNAANYTESIIPSTLTVVGDYTGYMSEIADFDLNGQPDLIYTDKPANSMGRLRFMANIENGNNAIEPIDFHKDYTKNYTAIYTGMEYFSTFNYRVNIAVGDIDNDGLEDVCVINFGEDKVWVFKNGSSIAGTQLGGTITSSVNSGNAYCSNDLINVSASSATAYTANNSFTVQLSDNTGSFSSPLNIATIAGTTLSSYNCAIPASVPYGTGYKVRVVSTSPYIVGADNGFNITISPSSAQTQTVVACGSYTWPVNGLQYFSSTTVTEVLNNSIGCDSTVTLNLTIKQPSSSTVTASACGTYTLNGQTYTSSGIYTQVIPNAANCDSTITLNLTIKQPSSSTVTASACGTYTLNGTTYNASGIYTQVIPNAANCDSTITLNLTIKQPSLSTITASSCGSFTLNGTTYNTSGVYTQVIPNAVNCDSTITLNLTIKQPSSSTVTASACGTYTLNGQTYTSSGTYTQVIPNAANCDSTITLNLTIKQPSSSTVNASACGTYTLNGQAYTSSGIYTQVIPNAANCDSTITLNLTIKQLSSSTVTASACGMYTLNGTTYNASGTYTQVIPNAANCDSTITLNLTIKQPSSSTVTASACGTYTLNGQAYTTSGTYTQVIPNAANCDSTITLNLTIKQPTSSIVTASACGTYTLNGQTYTSSGSYTQVIPNAANCDSTITLNLTIKRLSSSTITASACGTYTLNGTTYNTSGTYTQVIPNSANCDSTITLNLTIKQPSSSTIASSACGTYTLNGTTYNASGTYIQVIPNAANCDSTITLNLTIKQPSSSTITASACEAYTLNGQTYTLSGTYTQVIPNAANCDSTITLNLTIKQPSSSTVTTSACGTYTLNGTTYNTSGTYTQVIPNAANCDSTITLNLTIKQPSSSTVTASACGTYTLNGQSYTSSGIYTQVIPNAANCDSTITLNLTIKQPSSSTVTASACGTYTLNGTTYNTSGTYIQVIPNTANCDSTITLNLTIKQPSSSTITASACGTYTLNGTTYNTSGTYTQVIPNAANCDSTITLNLTIKQPSSSTITASACGTYTLNGQAYTSSGTYTQVIPNAANCDSTITLNLTIGDAIAPVANTATLADVTGCSVTSLTAPTATDNCAGTITGTHNVTLPITTPGTTVVTWTYADGNGNTTTQTQNVIITAPVATTTLNGITISATTSGATYQWVKCGSLNIPIAGATAQSFTPSANGSYAVIVTQNGCSVTSPCVTISTVGLEDLNVSAFTLYPNPNNGTFTVTTELPIAVRIYDAAGKLVALQTLEPGESIVELDNVESGVYFVTATDSNGQATVQRISVIR